MATYEPIPMQTNRLARQIVDCSFKVHSQLGPGLLESVYEVCLAYEVNKLGIPFVRQQALPVIYDGIRLDAGLRPDFIVANQLVVELKAAEAMHPVYEAQLLTYMKLLGVRVGLLINFNVPVIKDGIKRMVR
jgi:GxxExxY protein